MIILIASMSMLVAYFVARATPLGKVSEEPVTIKTVDEITAEVPEPDGRVFREGNINPSYEIQIEGTSQ